MKDQLTSRFNKLIHASNEEELAVLSLLLDGMERRASEKEPYVSQLLHFKNEVKEDTITMTMPISPLVHNHLGIVHGGIIATLFDTAMGTLVNTILPKEKAAVTTEIQVHYLKVASGDKLICTCSLLHKGSKTMVVEAKLHSDSGKLCAHSTGSFFIIPRPQ